MKKYIELSEQEAHLVSEALAKYTTDYYEKLNEVEKNSYADIFRKLLK